MQNQHLTEKQIGKLLAGEYSAEKEHRIMTHVAMCEQCQRTFDLMSSFPLAAPMELPAATTPRVKRQLFNQLHRSDLSGEILRFGTAGLVHVILSVLRIIPYSSSSS